MECIFQYKKDISVIIPTYNPGDYLFECLDALFSQTYSMDKFEILLVLNGEIDKYESKINSYIKSKDDLLTIKFLISDIPGVSIARNIGIENAEGEYICFIDDDDIVSTTYLERLKEYATFDTVVMSNIYTFKKNVEEKRENFFLCKQIRKKEHFENASLYVNRSFLSIPCAKIIHRNIIGERRFDRRFTNGEDALFITSISDKIKHIVFSSPDAIYFVREREGSASRKKLEVTKLLSDSYNLIMEYLRIYFKHPNHYSLMLFLSRIPGVLKNTYILSKNK